MEYTYIKGECYDLHIGKNNKFKTNRITIKFLNYLTKENRTKRVLIPNVLKSGTNIYSSKIELIKKLEELYGMDLICSSNRYGNCSLIEFSISYIDKQYIGIDLTNEALDILKEIIFHPIQSNNHFKKKIVDEEKRLLFDTLQNMFEDKNNLAIYNFNKIMFKGENASIEEFGKISDLQKINEKNLFIEYQNMLNNDMVDIIVDGNFDFDIKNQIREKFPFIKRNTVINPSLDEVKKIKKIKKVIEYDDIEQAKLILGYRINLSNNPKDFYTQVVFQTILSDSPNSKLFINLREKNSLCYMIELLLSTNLNYGIVFSLIDWNNYDLVVSSIQKCIDEIKNGEFFEKDIKDAILLIKNDIYEQVDVPSCLSQECYNKKLYNRSLDLKEIFDTYDSITKDDVINFSKKINLDTIYMLRGYNNE